ncbi:MAG: helix-turn-helix domain-containing protein [Bacteroidota bacterium]|nr:helix-turn-helix domain-containing protein [Bacteroidota bacterium]
MKNVTPNEVTFDNMPQAVAKVYDEVFLIKNQLAEIKKDFAPKVPTEYLTRNEVAEWLKCDLSTIHNWTKKGTLIPYGIGNRVYYKRNEVEAVLIPFGKNRGADNV